MIMIINLHEHDHQVSPYPPNHNPSEHPQNEVTTHHPSFHLIGFTKNPMLLLLIIIIDYKLKRSYLTKGSTLRHFLHRDRLHIHVRRITIFKLQGFL